MCSLPGAIQWPSFGAWKVTVTSAATAIPSTSPLEALTPDAMSVATTGASASFIASIAEAAGSRGVPAKPVPKIASMTTPAPSIAAGSSPGSDLPRPARTLGVGPGVVGELVARREQQRIHLKPVSRRARAATSPSPPLLPLPQTTPALFEVATSAAASATARPAVSISSSEGTPRSLIAQRSVARISSASRQGSSQSSIGASLPLRDMLPVSMEGRLTGSQARTLAALVAAAALYLVALAAPAAASTTWLCKPGVSPDPCFGALQTTVIDSSGQSHVENPRNAKKPKIDCFYVYPTVSDDKSVNSDLCDRPGGDRRSRSSRPPGSPSAAASSRRCTGS